jgi:polyferredoxin
VREWRWRALHFAAILVVATESVLGLACPLTVWEDALRGHRARDGFIERWIGRILFFDLPAWVFLVAYICFALFVAITWVIVPPGQLSRRHRHSR